MDTGTLEKKIAKLPEKLKLKVEGYVDALLDYKDDRESLVLGESKIKYEKSKGPQPVFGSGKGLFGNMADDFDAPLEDLKDYM